MVNLDPAAWFRPATPSSAAAPSSEVSPDYDQQQFEMALRESANEASEERLRQEEEAAVEAAKRASLFNVRALHSQSEALSYKYWSTGSLRYADRIGDCCYALHGDFKRALTGGQVFAGLDELRELHPRDVGDLHEVLLIDNDDDPKLLEVQEVAAEAMAGAVYEGPLACVRTLAKIVSEHMGGAFDASEEAAMRQRWAASTKAVKAARQKVIVPIAQLTAGLAAHRAIFFKFLADASNVPCSLTGGNPAEGGNALVQAVVRIADKELLVDLTARPGSLSPWGVSAEDSSSLRPSSVELQRVAVADGAPNLAQISAAGGLEWQHSRQNLAEEVDTHHERWHSDQEDAEPRHASPRASAGRPIATEPFVSPFHHQRAAAALTAALSSAPSSSSGGSVDATSCASGLNVPPQNPAGLAAAASGAAHAQGSNVAVTASQGGSCLPQDSTDAIVPATPSGEESAAAAATDGDQQAPQTDAAEQHQQDELHSSGAANTRAALPPAESPDQPASPVHHRPKSLADLAREEQSWQALPAATAQRQSHKSGSGFSSPSAQSPQPPVAGPSAELSELGCSSGAAAPAADAAAAAKPQTRQQVSPFQAHTARSEQGEAAAAEPLPPELRHAVSEVAQQHLHRSHSASELTDRAHSAASSELPSFAPLHLPQADEWEIEASEVLMGPRIGIGSFGEVFRGSWRHTDVAVKRLLEQDIQPHMIKEFRAEVALMQRLKHPNVVLFMGACTQPPHLCIVTQFVARGSLFRLLHRTQPPMALDEKRRLLMALDIARGMHYLHSCRPPIVHRDLKSPNLLVDRDFTIKVCDFGLSRVRRSTWLSSKSQAGTPEWCAPEVLRSQSYNEKSDVYSFGVILWELATGKEPWEDASPMQVVGQVGWGGAKLPIPDTVDPGLAAIITSCWAEPEDRPSFADLLKSIRDLAAARGLMSHPPHQPLRANDEQFAAQQRRPTPVQSAPQQADSSQQPAPQQAPPPPLHSVFQDAPPLKDSQQMPPPPPRPRPLQSSVPLPLAKSVSDGAAQSSTALEAAEREGRSASAGHHASASLELAASGSMRSGGASQAAEPGSSGSTYPGSSVQPVRSMPAMRLAGAASDASSGSSGQLAAVSAAAQKQWLMASASTPLAAINAASSGDPGSPPSVVPTSRDAVLGLSDLSGVKMGEPPEPSARKLAAEAARVASSKLARGLSNSLRAGVGGITAGTAGLVGAARAGAGRLEAAVTRAGSVKSSHGSSPGHASSDYSADAIHATGAAAAAAGSDEQQLASPNAKDEQKGCSPHFGGGGGGPFAWLHHRMSDASPQADLSGDTTKDEAAASEASDGIGSAGFGRLST